MDAQGWDARYSDAELVWSQEPNQFVAQFVSELTPGSAIDLGAGEGRNAVWLARQGWDVTAVDFSAVGLEKARRMAFEAQVQLATVVSDAETFEPTYPVDLVLLSYLQVPDVLQTRVLRRIQHWVKPDGLVLVIAHDKSNVELGHGGPPDPGVCYTVEQTVAGLEGMRIDFAQVMQRRVAGAIALDTVVLAVAQ